MRAVLFSLPFTLIVSAAFASSIEIPLPEGVESETIQSSYDCGERTIPVTYINAGDISLAVLELEEKTVVAANVLSGSGARYAGGQYIWWNKGNEASLYDLMDGGEETPAATCTESE